MAAIIDGKALAKEIRQEVKKGVAELGGPAPLLVAVEVGHDEASASYVKSQAKTAGRLGIGHRLDTLDGAAPQDVVTAHLDELARDPAVTAVMLQMPLPDHLDASECRAHIAPEKDVEAVTETASGRLLLGTHEVAPPTAVAAFRCLAHAAGGDVKGLDVAVLGRSAIVGRPLALLLLHANATVTICHTRTRNLKEKLLRSDAVVVAAGRPRLVSGDMIPEGGLVVDVGTNWIEADQCLVGDIDFATAEPRAKAITPVPGGVGPVTVAILMSNVLSLTRRQRT